MVIEELRGLVKELGLLFVTPKWSRFQVEPDVFLLLIRLYQFLYVYLHSNTEHIMANNGKNEALNRLRVVLAEHEKTNRWLAEQLLQSK